MGKTVRGKTGKANPPKKVIEGPSPEAEWYLIWRFGRLDLDSTCKFSWQMLEACDVAELERELVKFQNWKISTLRRKGWLKFIGKESMKVEAQRRLAEINKLENGLWQLHLHRDKWRVWGYFEEPEFYFLWWDK